MRPRDRNVNYINTSLLHQHFVYKHKTLTLSENNNKMDVSIDKCLAYDRLDKHIKQSYVSYGKLCETGELGHIRGMYEPHQCYNDEMKPAKHTSDYLRGGVISTVAAFEAFVGDLLNEATDLIAVEFKGKEQSVGRINSPMFKRLKGSKDRLRPKNILLHEWDRRNNNLGEYYSRYLLNNREIQRRTSFIDMMLGNQNLQLKHKIRCGDKTRISEINVMPETKCFICIMLRFCYGIRNVMAHGNAQRTIEESGGALNNFPTCDSCQRDIRNCPTCICFKKIQILVNLYKKYIHKLKDETERSKAEGMVRRIPTKKDFEYFKKKHRKNLTESEWNDCFQIIGKYFTIKDSNDPLPAPFAYFHMLRVYDWLVESRRYMYVTYGLFEHITQFIHTLSFRMYRTVAQLLIDNYGLPDGVWEVNKLEISNFRTSPEHALLLPMEVIYLLIIYILIIFFQCYINLIS